jgi:hypothetical protein
MAEPKPGTPVSDPHPSTEEHYDRIPHPGGTHTPPDEKTETAVNPSGKPRKKPDATIDGPSP